MKKQLENYLHEHIPLSKAMGIEVIEAVPEKVILGAPLADNINHKKTVFGGSLHAVATLACWSLLYINLKKMDSAQYQIVIADSQVSYQIPISSDFQVECKMPDQETWQRFAKILLAKGKARIKLSASISHHGQLAVDYHATFAAIQI